MMRTLISILFVFFSCMSVLAGGGDTYKHTSTIGTENGERLEMVMVRGRNSKGSNGMVILVCGIKDTRNYRAFVEFRTGKGNNLLAQPITPRGGNNIDRHKDIVFFECYFKEEDLDIIKYDSVDTIIVGGVHFKLTESGNRKLHTIIEKMLSAG
ncbi:MAG: hypothetical protein IKP37_13870 [Paludibacteraceae bacterium]|nr:hypothetical protein [Paludibacteraceae bacterium]